MRSALPPPPHPLDAVIHRLASHPLVAGVLVIGSAARGRLTPTSDYDLLVILGRQPLPLRAVLTRLAGREAEVFFVPLDLIRTILDAGPPLPPESDAAFVVHWLRDGRLAFDRRGDVSRAQRAVRACDWIPPPGAADRYALWFKLNSYIRQIDRLARSEDPVDRLAAELKLAGAAEELLMAAALLHDVPWYGPKQALRRIAAADPAALSRWQALVSAPHLADRLGHLHRLAAAVLAPLGGLWGPDDDGLQLEPGTPPTPELLARLRAFRAELLGPGA